MRKLSFIAIYLLLSCHSCSHIKAILATEAREAREGGINSLPPNVRYTAPGLPLRSPRWPQNRGYEEVTKMLSSPNVESTDFVETLDPEATVLEIGFGNGVFLSDLKKARPDIKTIGVSVTSWAGEDVNTIDDVYLQYIPDDLTVLEEQRGQVDLVTDVFSAATFADNPLHALIYSAMLLKPGGRYYGISALLDNKEEGLSAFGSLETRRDIVNFFREQMGINLVFEVIDLPVPRMMTAIFPTKQLLIYFEAMVDPLEYDYNALVETVNQEIGIPQNRKAVKSMGLFNFGKFRITSKDYIKD